MMGKWQDIRSATGRLVGRIDAERRLLEIVRNGDEVLVDLDEILVAGEGGHQAGRPGGGEQPGVGPGEVK